jgi:hypothetical protein
MEWTKADSARWAEIWNEPVMQKGLDFIKQRMRPQRRTTALVPNVDYLPIFASVSHIYEGRQEVLDEIENLKTKSAKTIDPLPDAWSHVQPEDQIDNE